MVMANALSGLDNMLAITAQVLVTRYAAVAGDLFAGAEGCDLAEIVEVLDDKICALCRALDGKIIKRGTPDFTRYHLPSHINCRRILSWIGPGEVDPATGRPVEADDLHIDPQLIDKHGHFVLQPAKYAHLRVPARPEGRDFIFIRGKRGEPGRIVWREGLPDHAVQDAVAVAGRNLLGDWMAGDVAHHLVGPGLADLAYHAAARALLAPSALAGAADWPAAGHLTADALCSVAAAAASRSGATVALGRLNGSPVALIEAADVRAPGLPPLPEVYLLHDVGTGRVLRIRSTRAAAAEGLTDLELLEAPR